MMNRQKVVLIDAHALIHRAYHALPSLTDSSGTPIQAVYGFTKILLRVINNLKPEYLITVFDTKAPTFRHVAYKEYKANRPPAPDDLKVQFPLVRSIVKDLELPLFSIEGYEADDVIGSLVDKFVGNTEEIEVYIVTGDWDAAQLVSDRVKIFPLTRRIEDFKIFGIDDIKEKFDLEPSQIIDFKALKGDVSDNIPGVKGIGDKSALLLLHKYKTLVEVYENIDEVESKYQKKLVDDKENAFLSKDLATIRRDVPLDFNIQDYKWKEWEKEKVVDILDKYGFTSLKKSFIIDSKEQAKKDEGVSNEQLSLV